MVTVIEVAIGPGGAPGVFRVEVVASPAGEASVTVQLDADALLARRGQLQQAVLASAVPSRRLLPETEQPVREAGQALFAGLLGTGEVAGRYRAAAAVAAERGEGLRVVLRIDTPALASLPWEAMFDQAAGAYVSGRTSWSVTSRSPRRRHRCGSGRRCEFWVWSPPPAACPRWTWRRSRTS